MTNIVNMPRDEKRIRSYTELDDDRWWLTEKVLDDPVLRRRLIRTQIEELSALHGQYPLPEFDIVERLVNLAGGIRTRADNELERLRGQL